MDREGTKLPSGFSSSVRDGPLAPRRRRKSVDSDREEGGVPCSGEICSLDCFIKLRLHYHGFGENTKKRERIGEKPVNDDEAAAEDIRMSDLGAADEDLGGGVACGGDSEAAAWS